MIYECHFQRQIYPIPFIEKECHFQRQIYPIPFIEKDLIKKLSPGGNYKFKVNNRNTRTRCEICSNVTIKTPEQRHWYSSGDFIVNFEHTLHLALVLLFSIFEQVNTGWVNTDRRHSNPQKAHVCDGSCANGRGTCPQNTGFQYN